MWFLLTADFGITNIVIGLVIALLLPPYNIFSKKVEYEGDLLKEIMIIGKDIIIAIPQAYKEALEMMITPHRHEEIVQEKVQPNRSKLLIFFETYIITFTPKAVVLHYNDLGWYDVHYVRRKSPQ